MTDHNGRITPAQEKLVRDTPDGPVLGESVTPVDSGGLIRTDHVTQDGIIMREKVRMRSPSAEAAVIACVRRREEEKAEGRRSPYCDMVEHHLKHAMIGTFAEVFAYTALRVTGQRQVNMVVEVHVIGDEGDGRNDAWGLGRDFPIPCLEEWVTQWGKEIREAWERRHIDPQNRTWQGEALKA